MVSIGCPAAIVPNNGTSTKFEIDLTSSILLAPYSFFIINPFLINSLMCSCIVEIAFNFKCFLISSKVGDIPFFLIYPFKKLG